MLRIDVHRRDLPFVVVSEADDAIVIGGYEHLLLDPIPLRVDVRRPRFDFLGRVCARAEGADRGLVQARDRDAVGVRPAADLDPFFFSSVRTSFATAFSVSNTPVPFIATASNVGSPLKLSWPYIASIGMAVGRSRLLNCSTYGTVRRS